MESVVVGSVLMKMDSLIISVMFHNSFLTLFLPHRYRWFAYALKLEFANNALELFMYGNNWTDVFKYKWKPLLFAFFAIEALCFAYLTNYPVFPFLWVSYVILAFVICLTCYILLDEPVPQRMTLTVFLICMKIVSPFGEFILDMYVVVCAMLHFYEAYKDNLWKLYLLCFMTFYSLWFTEMALLSKLHVTQVILFSPVILFLLIMAVPTTYRCRFFQLFIILSARVFYTMITVILNNKESLFSSLPSFENITLILEDIARRKRKVGKFE